MLAGLKGFEAVADRWEEGIGRTEDLRTSHTLDALGGRRIYSSSGMSSFWEIHENIIKINIILEGFSREGPGTGLGFYFG